MSIQGTNNPSDTNISDDVLRELFHQMDIPIMVADLETDEILYANDKMNAAYNVDDDPTGKRCWETYHWKQGERCDFCPLHQLKKDISKSIEWEIYNEATERWYHNKSSIIRWTNGRLVHLEQGTDITDIRKAHDALNEAEAYTQMMLDSTPLSCAVWDEEGNLLDTNQESLRLFGLKEKPDYLVNFYSLSPERQADGEPSMAKAKRMVSQALASGYLRFNWDFKTGEGERLPADVVLIRVPYKNEFRVLSYTRDMREVNKAVAANERYTNLLQKASDIAVSLMDAMSDNFEDALIMQLKLLGEAVGASRVSVWENYMQDEAVWHRQIYRWASDERWLANVFPMYYEEDYGVLPNNAKKLFDFQTINSRICDMAEAERVYFTQLGLKAILMIPIMTGNKLWGFIAFDNCVDDELTPDIEVSVLKTTSIMIASAILRNRSKTSLIANEYVLKMDGKLLGAVNHVAATLLAYNTSQFTDLLQECLEILGRSVNASRVSVWRNFEDENGRLCSRMLSIWEGSQDHGQLVNLTTIDFATYVPEWDEGVTVRRDINMPLLLMSPAFRNIPKIQNSKSVILVRIEMDGEFWGFVAYIYDKEERLLEQAETEILRSGGTMIASAMHRNTTTRELVRANEELVKTKTLLSAVNKIAELILSSEKENLTDITQRSLKMLGESVEADRVSLWQNYWEDDVLYSRRLPGWRADERFSGQQDPISIPLLDYMPEWEDKNGLCDVEVTYDEMNHSLKKMEILQGCEFLLLIPLSIQEKFWGFVGIASNCQGHRFGAEERNIIRSGTLMIVEYITRKNLFQNLREVERIAATDSLTDLLNRASFIPKAESIFERSKQMGKPASIMFLDIDHFKKVNDNYGHAFGDIVLVRLAEILKKSVRPNDLCARYGGEEFVIMLIESPIGAAVHVGERIMNAVREAKFLQEPDFSFTVSIGLISDVPHDEETLQTYIEAADAALYNAKNTGRNKLTLYADD